MKPVFLIGLCFLLVDISTLEGQRIWNLDQCLAYAWEHNLTVQAQTYDVKIRKTSYLQAANNLLPTVTGQTSLDQYFGRSIDPGTNSYVDVQFLNNSYGIYSAVDVFSGFMKLNTLAMERQLFHAEENELQKIKNEVAFSVINGYFDVWLKEGLTAIARENYQLSWNQRDYLVRLVEVGRKAGADLLEVEANLAADSFLLVQSHHLLEEATLGLKYQMNFPLSDTLPIDTTKVPDLTGNLDTLTMQSLFALASEALPDLKIAENQLNAAKKAVQISQGAFSPRIGFYSGWSSDYTSTMKDDQGRIIPFPDQISNNGSEYLSLGIEIPLFDRFSKYTSLKKYKLLYSQAKVKYNDEANKLKMGAEKSLTDWRSSRAEYVSAQKQLAQSAKAFEAAQKKLDKGLISIIEFYIQKNKVFRAKTEVLRTGLQVLLQERYIRFLMTGSWSAG